MTSVRIGPALRYKGYTGSIEASVEDDCLHGRLQHIDDVITYEGQTVADIKRGFESAVDGYLMHCAATGKQPERQHSGSFNVRVGAELHRWIIQYGASLGLSLNDVVCRALETLRDVPTRGTAGLGRLGGSTVAAYLRATAREGTSAPSANLTTSFDASGPGRGAVEHLIVLNTAGNVTPHRHIPIIWDDVQLSDQERPKIAARKSGRSAQRLQ